MVAASVPISTYPDTTRVLRGRDMLCFSHDWSGDPLSKTHLMRLLSRDNRILWVNSIGYRAPTASTRDLSRIVTKLKAATEPVREVEPNIFVLNPLVVPAYGVPGMQKVNRELLKLQVWRAMNKLGFRRVVNWVFNPAAAVIAGALGEDLLVYYCVDEYTAFSGVPPQLIEMERGLIRKADVVIVSAEKLYRTKSVDNPRTTLVRHGVMYDHFRKALAPETRIPDDVARLPKPVIGYFGLMAADWIDIDSMVHVAKHFSSGSMVLLGKVTTDISRLTALPNVHVLGRKPFETLPAYSKAFDVAINPFPISEVTLNANPLKVREYLAAGLPVVSTRIPEVEVIKEARIADTKEGFVKAIEEALQSPGPSAARSECMRNESWEAKLEEVRRAVAALGRGGGRAATCKHGEHHVEALRTIRHDLEKKAEWCYESSTPKAILKVLATDGTAAMILYRLMQASGEQGLAPLEMVFNKLNTVFGACIIGRGAVFGDGLVIIHSQGIVVNGYVKAGKNLHLEHQVTIGAERRQSPIIGDDVFIGAGAKIIGAVTIGDGARIGANAVVVHDVEPHTTVVGIPAKPVRRRALEGQELPPDGANGTN